MIPNTNSRETSRSYESELLKSIGLDSNHYLDLYTDPLSNGLRDTFEESTRSKKQQKAALKILSNLDELKISIRIDRNQEVFTESRSSYLTEKEKRKEEWSNHKQMKDFCEFTEERMLFDHILRSNMESESKNFTDPSHWNFITNQDGVNIIRDKEWPLVASFLKILIANPYGKTPYPNLTDFYRPFSYSRQLRLGFINSVSQYELYSENKLIFKKSGNKLEFYDQKLFTELCTPLKSNPWLEVINEEFIENAIKKGYTPENCRTKLEKHKGRSLKTALEIESNLYGNKKRVRQILNEELRALEPIDQFIFTNIQYLCNEDLQGKGHFQYLLNSVYNLKNDYSAWYKVQKQYKYLKHVDEHGCWRDSVDKLKTIRRYLSGKIELSSLNLNSENYLEVLKFVKMFDLAISLSNCMRFKKIFFERGSYKLRETIMKKTNLLSHVAFSKTLINKKILDMSYLANSKNWLDERVGMHAKLYANSMILAASLSGRIRRLEPNQKLISCRGNSGSGKTFFLGSDEGILNVDFIKSFLKNWTGVTNQQIHFEGKFAIFEHLFKQIANFKVPHFSLNSTMTGLDVSLERLHYILDSRLIKPEFIKEYLVEPAKKRNYTVVLNDLDVPLLTTLNRVLNRNPKGKDPIPTLEAMKSGLKEIRQYRKDVIDYVKNEDLIEEYNLCYLGKRVATKTGKDKIEILDHENYKECFDVPSEIELEKIFDRVIDAKYIQEAILRGDIKEKDSGSLEYWIGKTVRFALETHANSV